MSRALEVLDVWSYIVRWCDSLATVNALTRTARCLGEYVSFVEYCRGRPDRARLVVERMHKYVTETALRRRVCVYVPSTAFLDEQTYCLVSVYMASTLLGSLVVYDSVAAQRLFAHIRHIVDRKLVCKTVAEIPLRTVEYLSTDDGDVYDVMVSTLSDIVDITPYAALCVLANCSPLLASERFCAYVRDTCSRATEIMSRNASLRANIEALTENRLRQGYKYDTLMTSASPALLAAIVRQAIAGDFVHRLTFNKLPACMIERLPDDAVAVIPAMTVHTCARSVSVSRALALWRRVPLDAECFPYVLGLWCSESETHDTVRCAIFYVTVLRLFPISIVSDELDIDGRLRQHCAHVRDVPIQDADAFLFKDLWPWYVTFDSILTKDVNNDSIVVQLSDDVSCSVREMMTRLLRWFVRAVCHFSNLSREVLRLCVLLPLRVVESMNVRLVRRIQRIFSEGIRTETDFVWWAKCCHYAQKHGTLEWLPSVCPAILLPNSPGNEKATLYVLYIRYPCGKWFVQWRARVLPESYNWSDFVHSSISSKEVLFAEMLSRVQVMCEDDPLFWLLMNRLLTMFDATGVTTVPLIKTLVHKRLSASCAPLAWHVASEDSGLSSSSSSFDILRLVPSDCDKTIRFMALLMYLGMSYRDIRALMEKYTSYTSRTIFDLCRLFVEFGSERIEFPLWDVECPAFSSPLMLQYKYTHTTGWRAQSNESQAGLWRGFLYGASPADRFAILCTCLAQIPETEVALMHCIVEAATAVPSSNIQRGVADGISKRRAEWAKQLRQYISERSRVCENR